MNTDIRLSLSIRTHPKTKKLKFMLGSDGVLSFIWLLMFVAESRPDGDLAGLDTVDIALAADWQGEPSEFVSALARIGFLEQSENGFQIHDWKQHNPWAANAKSRSDHARKAASARWGKYGCDTASQENQRLIKETDAPSTDGQCSEHKRAMNSDAASNAPSPAPIPIPTKRGSSRLSKAESNYSPEFEEIWAAYPKRNGSNPKKAAYFAYRQRIKEGINGEEIRKGLHCYAAWSQATGKIGTETVMQAKRFFGPGREWDNEWALPSRPMKLPRDNKALWDIRTTLGLPFEYENLEECHSEIHKHLAQHPEKRQLIEGMI